MLEYNTTFPKSPELTFVVYTHCVYTHWTVEIRIFLDATRKNQRYFSENGVYVQQESTKKTQDSGDKKSHLPLYHGANG